MDFENPKTNSKTYAGHPREVIKQLDDDISNNDYSTSVEYENYDPALLANPNFEAYKYSRKQLISWIVGK